jgi:hypothetical protein
VPLRVVNVPCNDFEALACIRRWWSQCSMARRWVWSFWEAAVRSLSDARTAVSSAKVAMLESGKVGMSAV